MSVIHANIIKIVDRYDSQDKPVVIACLLFISHYLIVYESSRGHIIDGTESNQTGNTFGEKKSTKSRLKKTDKQVASKGHGCQEGAQTRQK